MDEELKAKIQHYFAFRLYLINGDIAFYVVKANRKQYAYQALPEDHRNSAVHTDCRSYADRESADWQIEKWKKEIGIDD